MCAIGRCLKEESFKNVHILSNQVYMEESLYLNKELLRTLVKEEYQDITIWRKLQDLHDTGYHWEINEKGGQDLTSEGKKYIKSLRELCRSF